jgi:hypothetical protein
MGVFPFSGILLGSEDARKLGGLKLPALPP